MTPTDMTTDETFEIDGPDFKATKAVETIHNGREALIRTCYELVDGRWEGFVSFQFIDPVDLAEYLGRTQMTTADNRPPRMRIVWDVLEGAKDAGDDLVVAACRRLINANRMGSHGDRRDYQLVLAFAE